MQHGRVAAIAFSILASLSLGACAGRDAYAPSVTGAASASRDAASRRPVRGHAASSAKIQHVVYIIQENRSFNYMFMGFKGATTQNYGYDTNGDKIALHPTSLSTIWDVAHGLSDFLNAYDYGAIDGWNNEGVCCKGYPANAPYAYAPKKEVKPYWDMAEQYALSDMTFQSNLDGSFVAHLYSVAAQADHEVDYPSTYWSCAGNDTDVIPTITKDRNFGPNVQVCQDYPTLADEMDAAGIPWRFYTGSQYDHSGIWSSFAPVSQIYNGPDWNNDVISPQSQFISDVGAGTLASVTWITPTQQDSDHGGMKANGGPAWVASLVNAVGQSKFWDSTAIFVIWDDWGGWFDPVAPVYKDYDGLGFRVPLIMISPYAKAHYVTHVQYESSSVLRFMEDTFGLKPLAASDRRAADPADDAFDFKQKPIPFTPIPYQSPKAQNPEVVPPPVAGD